MVVKLACLGEESHEFLRYLKKFCKKMECDEKLSNYLNERLKNGQKMEKKSSFSKIFEAKSKPKELN